jgi:hypothetical protein
LNQKFLQQICKNQKSLFRFGCLWYLAVIQGQIELLSIYSFNRKP